MTEMDPNKSFKIPRSSPSLCRKFPPIKELSKETALDIVNNMKVETHVNKIIEKRCPLCAFQTMSKRLLEYSNEISSPFNNTIREKPRIILRALMDISLLKPLPTSYLIEEIHEDPGRFAMLF